MCLFISIQRFLLLSLFSALLGLLSADSFAADGYYLYSNYGNTVRVPSDGDPSAVCSACSNETLCHWAQYDQHIVSVSVSGSAAHPNCAYVFRQGTSTSNSYWTFAPSGTYYGCPSGQQYDQSLGACKAINSCISGVTVAGSGSPVGSPGYDNVGKSISYCSSDKCLISAWESIEFSACPDNSTSCAPVVYKRSNGTQTGDACSSPSSPPDLPPSSCSGGMTLLGGVCTCPAGARMQGGVCRQLIDCSTGYHRVNDSCIADACPAGEIMQDNRCIPDPRSGVENPNPAPGEPPISCASGRHYDVSLNSCVANTSVNGGTSGSPGTPGNPNSGSGSGSGTGTGTGSGGGLPGESGSAESSDCAQPPVCAGDAVQCALLTQVWRNHCDAVPDVVISEHPVPPVQSVDVSSAANSALSAPAAVVFSASCPAPVSFSVQGRQYQLDWQPVCTAATSIRPVIIGIAYFLGLLIVAGVRRAD